MALSAQSADLECLVLFKEYAERLGCRVTESLPQDKPDPTAHMRDSWHYDVGTSHGQRHSKAADINYGAPGAGIGEREMLRHLVVVGESLGLGIIYALYGTIGSAGAHKTHLHADVGSVTNLGKGARRNTPGDQCVWMTQRAIHAERDNLAGRETKTRLYALREASRYGGNDFPYGVEFAQDVVGTKVDNAWGPNSRSAHDTTTEDVQAVWSKFGLYDGELDGVWGPKMEAAWKAFLARYGR